MNSKQMSTQVAYIFVQCLQNLQAQKTSQLPWFWKEQRKGIEREVYKVDLSDGR